MCVWRGRVDTLTFARYRGSDYFLGFKILNFVIFGYRGFMGMRRYVLGVSFSTSIFGVSVYKCWFYGVSFI